MTGHTITVRLAKSTLAKWQNYIGRGYAMRVSYDAVVTSGATTQVDNEFYMSTLPDKKKVCVQRSHLADLQEGRCFW